jgi:hypothetical protein
MSATLDLDDVAAGHPRALQELEELRKEAARYRWLRECPTEMALRFGHVAPGHWDDQIDCEIAKRPN